MPAFSAKRFDALVVAVRTLYGRSIAFKKSGLNHGDLLELFVQEKHRDQVLEARKLFGLAGETQGFITHAREGDSQAKLYVTMNVSDQAKGWPFPKYMGDAIYAPEDSEARAKLDAWVTWRVNAAREWALVSAVLREMMERCTSPLEVRFFWPSIVTLINFAAQKPDLTGREGKFLEGLRDLADQLGTAKAPPNIPALPIALKQACIASEAAISRAMLFPNPLKEARPTPKVALGLMAYEQAPTPWRPAQKLPTEVAYLETPEGITPTY